MNSNEYEIKYFSVFFFSSRLTEIPVNLYEFSMVEMTYSRQANDCCPGISQLASLSHNQSTSGSILSKSVAV